MFIEVTNYESPGKVLINVNSITSISDAHHATAKSAIVYPVTYAGADDDGKMSGSRGILAFMAGRPHSRNGSGPSGILGGNP